MGNTYSTVTRFLAPTPKCNFDSSCMRDENSAVYQASYKFEEPNGYIKITTDLFDGNIYHDKISPESRKINYKIIRNQELSNEIRISGKLTKDVYKYVDESYSDRVDAHGKSVVSKFDVFMQPGKLWLPWWDNAITDHFADECQTKKYRGGNRILIDIRQAGEYEIMVPLDWDVDGLEYEAGSNKMIGDNYISKIFIHSDNGIYVKTQINYPFTKPYGYVKIISAAIPTKINVVRTTDKENIVTMEGLVEKKYITDINDDAWSDNTVLHNEKDLLLPNPNRIFITIFKPGNYTITLPDDCDLEIDNTEGDMTIKSGRGEMHLSATSLNRCGYSGYTSNNYNSWSYLGLREQGYSNLKTLRGHITIKD